MKAQLPFVSCQIVLDLGIEGGVQVVHSKSGDAVVRATIQAIWKFLTHCDSPVRVQRDGTYMSPLHTDVGYAYAVVDDEYVDDHTWPVAGDVWHLGA